MKIRFEYSSETPQFIVTSENEQEQAIIKMFWLFPRNSKKEYKFWLHGAGGWGGVYQHFNFGYIKCEKKFLTKEQVAYLTGITIGLISGIIFTTFYLAANL